MAEQEPPLVCPRCGEREPGENELVARAASMIARLVEIADALDQDAIAGTAETLRRAAAILDFEGGS